MGASRMLQERTWFDPEGDRTVDEVAAMYAGLAAAMVRAPLRVQ